MSIQNRRTAPFILRLLTTPFSALENLLPLTASGPNAVKPREMTSQDEGSFDQFIITQFLMYLYINVFVFPETSYIYKSILDNGLTLIRSQIDQIKDPELRALISGHRELADARTYEQTKLLDTVLQRIQPARVYPGLDGLIAVVLAMYNRSAQRYSQVDIHRISLQKVNGYDDPTFVLSPVFATSIDTSGVEGTPSLFWKLLFSFKMQDKLNAPGDVAEFFNLLSTLALPMDPTSITDQMRKNLSSNSKTGIPFINYLAMYVRQLAMGLDFNLSRMADSRRILMRRAQQFCGVGGTYISDSNYSNSYLCFFADQDIERSDSDWGILSALLKGRPDAVVVFTKKLKYDEAVEAVKPKAISRKKINDTTTLDVPAVKTTTPKGGKKVSAEDVADAKIGETEDAFASDSENPDLTSTQTPDTTTEQNQLPQPSDKTDDDNIDRTSDAVQDSAAANVKVFIPLTLPTETIDDYLLRVMVLRYVTDMEQDPSPDITPENLETLRYWCSHWLFIASIDKTKELLAKLNVKGQLKELKL